VDLGIVDYDKKRLLLAQKPNADLWQLVGGFTDPAKDKSAEDAARREGKEETSLDLELVGYVGSSIVDDWRYRREQDKILTFLYVMRYIGGEPKARDDIKFVKWAQFGEISEGDIMPMHRPLLSMLNDYFKGEILRLK